jgi:hypothetical protein
MIWLGSLAVGLVVALALRTNRPPESPPEPRTVARSAPTASSADGTEVEIELADPGESGFAAPERGAPAGISTEKDLVDAMRASFQNAPERTISLAELGENRFGDSPRALERRLYEIKALVQLGRVGSARTKAERCLALYPPGPMTDEVEKLTGVHRRPEPSP